MPLPSLGVVMAMYLPATRGTLLGQGCYFLAKLWILALPLIWVKYVEQERFHWSPPRHGGFGFALLSGLLIGFLIYGVFRFLAGGWVDEVDLRQRALETGIGDPVRYLWLACYLTVVNALLEEYVWRWFCFRRCTALMGEIPAMLATALFFTLHHVLALHAQFDWQVTLLGSMGVFTGSLIWSWCYRRYRSIWPAYLNHLILDAVIFVIGWQLLFG